MPKPKINSATPATPATPLAEVRSSPVHGHGVFALRALRKGTFVALYEGRRYTAEELGEVDWDDRVTYLFSLSDGTTIDGAEGGNFTRHLNHACLPNCEAEEFHEADGRLSLRIGTIRPIRAGDEMFIDYSLTIDETANPQDYGCRCGSPTCRGVMVGIG